MTIEVRFYGRLRDDFKCAEMSVEAADGIAVETLVAQLLSHNQGLEGLPIRFAVNDAFVAGEHRLKSGDNLVLMPPVSGG